MKLHIALSLVAAATSLSISMAHADASTPNGDPHEVTDVKIPSMDGASHDAAKYPELSSHDHNTLKTVDEGNPDPQGKPTDRTLKPGATSYGTVKREAGTVTVPPLSGNSHESADVKIPSMDGASHDTAKMAADKSGNAGGQGGGNGVTSDRKSGQVDAADFKSMGSAHATEQLTAVPATPGQPEKENVIHKDLATRNLSPVVTPNGNGDDDADKNHHVSGIKNETERKSGQVDAADFKKNSERKSGQVDAADFKKDIDPFPDPPNCVAGAANCTARRDARGNVQWREQGSQGIGVGAMTGNAVQDGKGPAPQTLQLEYFNVGKNPSQGGRGYGLTVDKLEFSGVTNGVPDMALETRGMSGWQIIGAGEKHPVMFHLGIEPLNFEGQVTSHIVDDARNTAARIAQSKLNQGGVPQQGQDPISQIGNPDAPVTRNQFMYYVPAISMGLEVRKAGCRFLGLVRGGAAGGGQLRTDKGYSYGVDPAYGAGVYVNCPQFDIDGEWTRIQQSDAPMDLLNADLMVKPFKNVPLAIGAEFGSTIVNSQDPKSVPLEVPGYGVKGASVETHAGAAVRLVF